MAFLASAVCFVVCHGGPADHFATFAEHLTEDGHRVEIYASGPALKKFQERGVTVDVPFSLDISVEEEIPLAEQIAGACSTASVVVTDVGHPFAITMQKALARQKVHRLAYYDNLESYVPGGYSKVAAEVMHEAEATLFANALLAVKDGQIGIGYYPTFQAEKIAEKRIEKKAILRQSFFEKNGLIDQGQNILVYFGGNNEEYFSNALPAFLSLLKQGDFKEYLFVLQQHPGAKAKNIDGKMVENSRVMISLLSSEDAQILADGALYYQTSMAPQFVLAGIPTVQIGHERYEDVLVKNGLIPSVTNVDEFIKALNQTNVLQKDVLEVLGMNSNWFQILKGCLCE